MAYLTLDDDGAVLAPPRCSPALRAAVAPRHDRVEAAPARLGPLEWSVIAIARRDRLSSLRRPGRLAVALRTLFGASTDLPLADARLEALRRMAVWSWHHGYAVPGGEVRAFFAAGFTPGQYELMLASMAAARREEGGRR